MMLKGGSSRWAAALALGLAGLTGVGAALVLASPARSEATAFELTFEAELEPPEFVTTRGGTFGSRAPFCASGSIVEVANDYVSATWRLTCDDGTGSLTVYLGAPDGGWRILDGSGSHTRLRGRGSVQAEMLCKPWLGESCDLGRPIPWRGTLVGVVDPEGADPETVAPTNTDTVAPTNTDTVAPTIAIASARAAKLPRPAGAYTIKVALALRDDVEGNPVWYRLRVATARGTELTRRFGTATTGAVSMTLRTRPPDGARLVRLQLTGVDPAGNAVSERRALRLPR
jgi:hypothetical protein